MIKSLLVHGYKNYFRSPVWGKSLAANIVLGLLALMMLTYVLLGGIFLLEIVERLVPDSDPQTVINGLVLYYFGIEFMLRFFPQGSPVLFIEPYLHLPIKRGGSFILCSAKVHYLPSISLLSFYFCPSL
jgi:hypothetical protein